MDPNQFRESRQAINRLCDNIDQLIEEKSMESSKECLEEVHVKLDTLRPHAEGEIQLRSVKNLGTNPRRVLLNRVPKICWIRFPMK